MSDLEPADWVRQREAQARTDYNCASCERAIPQGSIHSVLVWLLNKQLSTMREHLECRTLGASFREHDGTMPLMGLVDICNYEFCATPAQAAEFERVTGAPWWGERVFMGGEEGRGP